MKKIVHKIEVYDLTKNIELESDYAAENPVYVYCATDRKSLYYSIDLSALQKRLKEHEKRLKISNEGVSFLLQCGVVPPHNSVYNNFYILGLGDKAVIQKVDNKIKITFSHKFPFLRKNIPEPANTKPNYDQVLQMLAEGYLKRVDKTRPTYLFHSAGKDSNTIALALAEAGLQKEITLVTHRSKGSADESEISKMIANKLGFKHITLEEVDNLNNEHHELINNYFAKCPFPCTDNVSLAYPLYIKQLPDLSGSNIIDGGGNDGYFGIPLTQREKILLPLAIIFSKFSLLRRFHSESFFYRLSRNPVDRFQMSFFNLQDSLAIFPASLNTHSFTEKLYKYYGSLAWHSFKTRTLTSIVAFEKHLRKVRNFACAIDANLILPWCDEKIATYCYNLPDNYLFDKKKCKNKIFLRELLKERLDLDSDKIGKKGYRYDSASIIELNEKWVRAVIGSCNLWEQKTLKPVLDRLFVNSKRKFDLRWKNDSLVATNLIYQLLLLSLWFNNKEIVNYS